MPAHQPFDAETLEAFESAQRSTIAILGASIRELKEGSSEADIVELVKRVAGDHGFSQWYHDPEVRIDGHTSRFYRASADRKLKQGTLIEIDLGPANDKAYGDIGVALAFGAKEEPQIVTEARDFCRAICGFASRWKTVGELFVFAKGWSTNRRVSLGNGTAAGHVILAREGLIDSVWPQGARLATLMRRNQIQWYNPRRMIGAYAVRPQVYSGDRSVAFEEIVYVDGDIKRILGRDSIDQIGTW